MPVVPSYTACAQALVDMQCCANVQLVQEAEMQWRLPEPFAQIMCPAAIGRADPRHSVPLDVHQDVMRCKTWWFLML
ncbi:hypothetical protein C1H21_22180 [Xanthomonas arboricola pv. juglandis]|nr:hypothetical protein C1H21_22180 [Xanthomonas arboricola pv. juglandis]